MGDHAGANAVPADPAALTMLVNMQNAFVKSAFYVNLKLGEAVRVLNVDFTSDMQVFFKPEESQFRGCRTASQVHDGAWVHKCGGKDCTAR